MSKPQKYGPHFDVEDTMSGVVETGAKVAFWGGLLAIAIAVGFLVFTFMAFGGGQPPSDQERALSNIEMLGKLLLAGVISFAVGSTVMFWGEELLGVLQLVGAGLMWFAPVLVPMAGGQVTPVGASALAAIQLGGTVFGAIALGVLMVDLFIRAQNRAKQGTKADQLKYGKGIKEERDRQNVFMGKCWQLPFCRKFVRERCPIYHSKKTCWRERVGCMCEEEVIRNAMENRPLPKDALAASKYIPVNNRLNAEQKAERCRQCVIYNEHQKHKYKLSLPITITAFGAVYALGRVPLLGFTGGIISKLDNIVGQITFTKPGTIEKKVGQAPLPFQEILLICFMIVALAYTLKFLEYAIFRKKV